MNLNQPPKLFRESDTYAIIGLCMEVHRELGHGFLEIVYKDAIEHELSQKGILYSREKEFKIPYKNIILPHKFFADFVICDEIILEVKAAAGGFADFASAELLNYLRVSGCKIGLLVNFGRASLEHKRLVL
jgi:GxxExxY protein